MVGLLVLTICAGLMAVGCSSQEAEPEDYTPEDLGLQEIEPVNAPDFTIDTVDGGSITLSSLRGTPVLLNFWQIDCPPCLEEMPYLNTVATQYAGEAFVMAANIGDSPQSVQEFFGDNTINMIVPVDPNGYVASQYSVGFTPTTFLIDADGVARYVKVGPFASMAQVVASIELILPGTVT